MAKKTPMQRALQDSGVFPVAPVRLWRTIGWLNAVSSVLLGRDFENNFKGQQSPSQVDMQNGSARKDIVDLFIDPNKTIGAKLAEAGKAWTQMAIGSLSTQGFRRSLGPAIIGEVAFNVAKGMKANSFVPKGMRKVVRVY